MVEIVKQSFAQSACLPPTTLKTVSCVHPNLKGSSSVIDGKWMDDCAKVNLVGLLTPPVLAGLCRQQTPAGLVRETGVSMESGCTLHGSEVEM